MRELAIDTPLGRIAGFGGTVFAKVARIGQMGSQFLMPST